MASELIIRKPEQTYDMPEMYKRIEAELCKKPWGAHWLRHGRIFPVRTKQWHMEDFARPRRCYANSLCACQSVTDAHKDLGLVRDIRYAEGLMVEESGIYMHAWCTLDGEVMDFTFPEEAHKHLYFGIAFDLTFTWKAQLEDGIVYHGFIPRWERAEKFVVPYLLEQRTAA